MLENIILFVAGFLCVASLWTLWFSITPPKALIRILQLSVFRWKKPTYTDQASWEVYAAIQLKLLGKLLTCPKCLSYHISFWTALYLQLFVYGDTSTHAGMFLVCALSWPFLLIYVRLDGVSKIQAKPYKEQSLVESQVSGEVGRMPEAQTSKKPAKPTSPPVDSPEARLAFIQSRGYDAEILPGGQVLAKGVQPVHARIANLVKLDNSQACFFEGCDALLQPLRDKKKSVEDHQCPSCELGPVIDATYQSIVKHLRDTGQYDSLNS